MQKEKMITVRMETTVGSLVFYGLCVGAPIFVAIRKRGQLLAKRMGGRLRSYVVKNSFVVTKRTNLQPVVDYPTGKIVRFDSL